MSHHLARHAPELTAAAGTAGYMAAGGAAKSVSVLQYVLIQFSPEYHLTIGGALQLILAVVTFGALAARWRKGRCERNE